MNIKIALDGIRDYYINIEPIKGIFLKDKKVLIVTNPKVAGLHLRYLLDRLEAKEIYIVTIPDGEEYKNFESLQIILDTAFSHRLDRKSIFIAFGGGVIGDITGFSAAIFQRGIDFIQVPTTLLSMVDASVGGKTGINNKFGKNLIGSFHQPIGVYIDTHFLKTLPKREFSAGVAEIIKMAVTFDRDFFEWLEKNSLYDDKNLVIAIKRSVEIKAIVVSKDEKESGIRAALNYGHTFGHVIENLTNYKEYLHGEAVSIGMVMANSLALKLKNIDIDEAMRIKRLLEQYNLPTNFKIENVNGFYELFFLDKKSKNSKLFFILPRGIGNVEIRDDIPKEVILEVLKEFA